MSPSYLDTGTKTFFAMRSKSAKHLARKNLGLGQACPASACREPRSLVATRRTFFIAVQREATLASQGKTIAMTIWWPATSRFFFFFQDSESSARMGPVTPTVINKAGFVGVLSPTATRRDEGGILSASIARPGTPDYKTLFVRSESGAKLRRRRQM